MDDPTRRSKKGRQNGMRLSGPSFPSEGPFFLRSNATLVAVPVPCFPSRYYFYKSLRGPGSTGFGVCGFRYGKI